jgi:hydroxymethylglutaryl-CoA reductase (NADPH)
VLAISLFLNAYLIRGAARASSQTRAGGAVRFEGDLPVPAPPAAAPSTSTAVEAKTEAAKEVVKAKAEDIEQDSWARDIAALAPSVPAPVQPLPPAHAQTPAPSAGTVPTFSLDDVDRRLRARGAGRRSRTPARPRARIAGDSDGDADESSDELEVEEEEEEKERPPRPMAELVELLATLPKVRFLVCLVCCFIYGDTGKRPPRAFGRGSRDPWAGG